MPKQTLRVTVTASHIKRGKRFCIFQCPVALAFRSLRKRNVSVGADAVTLPMRGQDVYVALPKRVQQFIQRFDTRKAVKPFSFNITLPKAA